MTNETVTLHTDSWNHIESMLRMEDNPTAEAIAGTIEAQRGPTDAPTSPDSKTAIGFCGLPGAGKSYTAKTFGKMTGAEVISMGDAIRSEYENRHGLEYDSEELGEFAAQARAEDASQIPKWVTEIAEERDNDLFAIDGVRSVTDYRVLRRYFGNFVLVKVEAPFQIRLERLQERGREGEDEFDRDDLLERDLHELDKLGFHGLLTYADEWAEEYLPESKDAEFNTGAVGWKVTNVGDDLERLLQFVMEESELLPEPKT